MGVTTLIAAVKYVCEEVGEVWMGVGVVSRHDCVNACVQCMHLELVADLYMYSHVSVFALSLG